MDLLQRHLESTVFDRLSHDPAVVLLGPRQVGKTTLARAIANRWPSGSIYLDLERPADRRRLDEADAYLREQRGKLVVIDEIQRAPNLFEILRGIIDDRRATGERYGRLRRSAAISTCWSTLNSFAVCCPGAAISANVW